MSSLREYIVAPFEEFYKYRELIRYQLKGELKRRHFHKALGPIWWVGEPLALAVMFVFDVFVQRQFCRTSYYNYNHGSLNMALDC